MRLVRISDVARGSRPLELHPSLTVLIGASPEQRRRIGEVVAALGGSGMVPSDSATVDLHGVVVSLDVATVKMLRRPEPFPAWLRPAARAASPAPTTGDGTGDVADPSGSPQTLLDLADQRAELSARLESLRTREDPMAAAAVTSARVHLAAVEQRIADHQAEFEAQRRARVSERGALIAAADELRAQVRSLEARNPVVIAGLRDQLLELLSGPGAHDPAAQELATAIESVVEEEQIVEGRRRAAERQLAAAEAAHVEARAHRDFLERQVRHPVHDQALVHRLESIRDRIFAAAAAPSSGEDIVELRASEAEVLDELGYETYTAYVSGEPNARALAARAEELAAADQRLEAATDELVRLRALLPDEGLLESLEARRAELLSQARHTLAATVVGGGGSVLLGDEHRPDVVVAALREVRGETPDLDAPELVAATDALRDHLVLAGIDVGWARTPAEVAAVADVAVARLANVPAELDAARRTAGELDAEVDRLEVSLLEPVVGAAEDLDADLEAATERVAAAERRVADHEQVLQDIDRCRQEAVRLRDLERTLATPSPAPEVPVVPVVALPSASAEWELTCGIGARAVTEVGGSVPVLVDGLPVAADERDGVLRRLASLSPMVQVVVCTDDPGAAMWAELQGPVVARAVQC
ncbi:MAG: hypothetical protein ACKOYM_02965 [Actinomycetes bacterium]